MWTGKFSGGRMPGTATAGPKDRPLSATERSDGLICGGGADDGRHFIDPGNREASFLSMFCQEFNILRLVNAKYFITCYIALYPLDPGAHILQNRAGSLRNIL